MQKSTKSQKQLPQLFGVMVILVGLTVSFIPNYQNERMPQPDGEQLWKYISEKSNYKKWKHWPELNEMYEGESPHGTFLKLYVNDIAYKAIKHGDRKMPDNSTSVKENYNKQKGLVSVTPVYKVKNYYPEAGNWFWAKYDINGENLTEGKLKAA